MTFHTEHKGHAFSWHYDGLHGVGCFARRNDGALSNLETGTDCADVRRSLNRLKQKTASPNYPAGAPDFANILDSIAWGYSFD